MTLLISLLIYKAFQWGETLAMQEKGEGKPVRDFIPSLGAHGINSIPRGFRLSIVAPVERGPVHHENSKCWKADFSSWNCVLPVSRELDFDNDSAKRDGPLQVRSLSDARAI
jgi:hypothetical protein